MPARLLWLLVSAWVVGACSHRARQLAPEPVRDATAERSAAPLVRSSAIMLAWPVADPVMTAYFGWRGKRLHEGIDFRAPVGTRVYAAQTGRVIFAGRKLRAYGNMIVLDHGGGWTTVYAHLSRIRVRTGQVVGQRQEIALSGRTGRVTGPHLHFELRLGADPVDPLLFLPIGR